jgi:hypothetical protein
MERGIDNWAAVVYAAASSRSRRLPRAPRQQPGAHRLRCPPAPAPPQVPERVIWRPGAFARRNETAHCASQLPPAQSSRS